jgi:hypothetical protein
MEGLADHIVASLVEEGYDVALESIQAAIDSFVPPEVTPKPKAKGNGKSKAKAAADEDDEEAEVRSCERTIVGKDGSVRICGKNARNQDEYSGMWCCGTENSGHYKAALADSKKAAAVVNTAKGKAKAAKGKVAPKAAKASATSRVGTLINKIQKKDGLDVHEVAPGVWASSEHSRIVFDYDTHEACGVLNDDGVTVDELDDEALSYLEVHNLPIKAAPKAKGKAKVAPKASPKAKTTAVAKGKVSKVITPAPKGKVTSKVASKVAPKASPKASVPKAKAKAVPKASPKAKAVPKAKGKQVLPPSEEDEAMLDELKQGVDDVITEVEPDIQEDDTGVDAEAVEEAEIDLGVVDDTDAEVETDVDAEVEPDTQEDADADTEDPDIQEDDEGDAIEDAEGDDIEDDADE